MDDLKNKTIYGLVWSFVESFFTYFIQFGLGIFLARILSPKEFGLIGMIVIFITISKVFVYAGLGSALIRKKDCNQTDYSTVFYFSVFISFIFYGLLLLLSTGIANFYGESILKQIIRVFALGVIFDAFGFVHQTKLNKELNFKLQAKISFISTVLSGCGALIIAFLGYGVWALVMLNLLKTLSTSVLFWVFTKWRPSLVFNIQALKELFDFGWKLLVVGLIETVYRDGFYLIIGKYYAAAQLGFFNRADRFQAMISENIARLIAKVSYPVLSKVDDLIVLKRSYQKLVQNTMFITFVLMFGLAASAEAIILTLLGEKWAESILYLQFLTLVGALYPLQSLNTDILKVFGRSDLFLRLEIIKKIIAIPVLIFCALISIKILILGMVIVSILSCLLNAFWSSKLLRYSVLEQLKDIFPSFLFAIIIGLIVYYVGHFIETKPLVSLLIQLLLGISLVISIGEFISQPNYMYIKTNLAKVAKGLKNKI
jgi:O-antigen/teichoic acid export membrane protein